MDEVAKHDSAAIIQILSETIEEASSLCFNIKSIGWNPSPPRTKHIIAVIDN